MQLIQLLRLKVLQGLMDHLQFFQLLHQQEEVMVVQEDLILDQLQMVALEGQVVVVLGGYQAQVLLVVLQ